MSRRDWLLLVLLTLAAAYLRFHQLGVAEFKFDEADLYLQALGVVDGERPNLGADSSVGIPHPALPLYLLSVPLFFRPDPLWAVGWLALLNTLTVPVLYWTCRRHLGRWVAVGAAGLFAMDPWTVLFGKKIWTQVVPLINAGLYAALLELLARPDRLRATLSGLLLGLVGQSYALANLLVLPIGLTLAAARRRLGWGRIGLVGGAYLLVSLPYLAGVLRGGLYRPTALGDAPLFSPGLLPVKMATWLTSGMDVRAVLGGGWRAFTPQHEALTMVHLVVVAATLLGLLVAARRALTWYGPSEDQVRVEAGAQGAFGDHDPSGPHLLTLLWYVLPLAFLSLISAHVFMHYVRILHPVAFVLPGLGLAAAARRWRLVAPAAVALGLLLTVQAWGSGSLTRLVAEGRYEGGHGVPLADWLALRDAVYAIDREPRQLMVVAQGTHPQYEAEPAILTAVFAPRTELLFLDGRAGDALVLPARREAAYLVLASDWSVPTRFPAAFIEDHALRAGALQARLYRVAPNAAPLAEASPPARFSNGLALTAVRLPEAAQPGKPVEVLVRWTVTDAVTSVEKARNYSAFNHLLNAAGEKVAQADGMGWSSFHWEPGQEIWQWYQIDVPEDLPAGEYRVITGLYSLADFQRATVVASGADHVELGVVEVR